MAVTIALMESTDRQLAVLARGSGLTLTSTIPFGDFSPLERQGVAPDVLLIDLRGQAGLPAELQAFKRRHPKTAVVIVAAQQDPALMLAAMRAGVTEWLSDPVSVVDLKAAVARVVGASAPSTPGQVLAFIGAKGGVGTTTLAVNVAAVLAAHPESKVLMADLHVATYGDAALLLGVEPRFSVVDALENAHRLDEAFLGTLVVRAKSRVDLLASPERPSVRYPDAPPMRALIEALAASYRTVVLDVPFADLNMIEALEPATAITLVVNQELATVRRATKIAALLRQRHGKERSGLVVSRYDPRAEIGQDDIERVVGLPVWGVFPSDYRLAMSAANVGRPLVIDNQSRLPTSIREFVKRFGVESAQPARARQEKRVTRLASLF